MEEPSFMDDANSPLTLSRLSDDEVTGPLDTRETPSPLTGFEEGAKSEGSVEEGEESGQMALGESFSQDSMPWVKEGEGEGGEEEEEEVTSGALAEDVAEGGEEERGGEELTEDRIKTFLEEKANELKRMQTPLLEELTSIRATDDTTPVSPGTEGMRSEGVRPALSTSQRASWEAELHQELASRRGRDPKRASEFGLHADKTL